MKLKSNLRLQIEKHGITATQLSKRSGVSKQVLSTWLNGASPRKIEHVKRVAEALNLSIDELCFGDIIPVSVKDLSSTDEWMSGVFEVKFRRLK